MFVSWVLTSSMISTIILAYEYRYFMLSLVLTKYLVLTGFFCWELSFSRWIICYGAWEGWMIVLFMFVVVLEAFLSWLVFINNRFTLNFSSVIRNSVQFSCSNFSFDKETLFTPGCADKLIVIIMQLYYVLLLRFFACSWMCDTNTGNEYQTSHSIFYPSVCVHQTLYTIINNSCSFSPGIYMIR